MTLRTLLLDGDVLAYKCASAAEKATEWEPGYWTWSCRFEEVVSAIDAEINRTMNILEGDSYKLCLTDSESNFRRSILPSYKSRRSSVKKPLVLKAVRQWMIEEKGAYLRPGLEGDDCMGILATAGGPDAERIIVSIDKDMKTIPGLYVREVGDEPVLITEDQADAWHLYQTLTGDATDGYAGCPGVGPKKADQILSGLRIEEAWPTVVAAFKDAGLSEREALVQARVARILRASDYDFRERKPILWNPTQP